MRNLATAAARSNARARARAAPSFGRGEPRARISLSELVKLHKS